MPLGGKDILLIIRATDQASVTISRVAGSFGAISDAQKTAATNTLRHGAALTLLGGALIAVGKQGFDALNSWRSAAADYNQEAALTLTQIDQTGVKLEDVKRIGREVAMSIPAPFEQMQASLFDIFSSMDVNIDQAEILLTNFAKGAVAGQTDVQTAGRATITVMNAFKIPVQDVNKVMDTQFELVRKGVGTYKEFADVLGRVAPSAVRMGQNFETVAGMLAFLTRNGLSTAQASTSAARALDTLSKVKVQERLEKMGIAVRDAAGEYRPLVDIVGDMNNKFGELTKPERSKALEDLFFGAGNTVAARRFFDTVFTNFDQFQSLVADMQNSAGSMDDAYSIMFEQPLTQMQLFKNHLEVIKTELGDHLLAAGNKFLGIGLKITDWFENLSPGVKQGIVQFIAFASAASVVVGAVFALIGVFLIIKATLALAAVSLATVGAAFIAIIAIVAAVAVAGFLIYKNWSTLGPIFKDAFEVLRDWAQIAWAKIQEFADWVMTWLPGVWEDVQHKAKTAFEVMMAGGQLALEVFRTVVDWLVNNVPPAFDKIIAGAQLLWGVLQQNGSAFIGWLQENVFPVFIAFADMVTAAVDRIITIWNWLWENLMPAASFSISVLTDLFTVAFAIWLGIFNFFVAVVRAIWDPLWTFVKEIVSVAFNFIKQNIEAGLLVLTGIFNFFAALFRGDWAGMWAAIQQITAGAWQWITNIFNTAFDLLFAIVRGAMNLLWQIMQAGWDAILSFARTVPGKVNDALASLGGMLWDLAYRATKNMLDAMKNGMGEVIGFLASIPGKSVDAMSGLGSALFGMGADAIRGLLNGISSLAGAVADKARSIAKSVKDAVSGALHMNSPSRDMFERGTWAIQGFINGMGDLQPQVERAMVDMARRVADQEVTVPVGWRAEGGGAGGAGGRAPSGPVTIDLDININGAGKDAEEIARIAARETEKMLTEFYRELLTGVRA